MSPGVIVEVRPVQAEPTPAQRANWAKLWKVLLAAPENSNAPTGEVEASKSGTVSAVP